jgi:hypothetical protein
MKWRIVENKWNLLNSPWRGAIGIEEDDKEAAVPAMVCWFCRGWMFADVQRVVDQHNERADSD